jgi:hypothetical protein
MLRKSSRAANTACELCENEDEKAVHYYQEAADNLHDIMDHNIARLLTCDVSMYIIDKFLLWHLAKCLSLRDESNGTSLLEE